MSTPEVKPITTLNTRIAACLTDLASVLGNMRTTLSNVALQPVPTGDMKAVAVPANVHKTLSENVEELEARVKDFYAVSGELAKIA